VRKNRIARTPAALLLAPASVGIGARAAHADDDRIKVAATSSTGERITRTVDLDD
jgi:hypothetical protein